MKPRKRIRSVSLKRQRELREYRKLKDDFLKRNQVCWRCLLGFATDVHHKQGRGPNLNRVETWAALCRACHDWIHKYPAEATKHGWFAGKGKWMGKG